MDCEKFEQHLMDALYEELDPRLYADFRRHLESCSRCSATFSELRATRDVGVLPLEEPRADLEPRILAAALKAQEKTPWHRKALRVLAWAGSHAMRPQLAMAALFVLVVGSSLLLLRPQSTKVPSPVRVTERGMPVPEPLEARGDPSMPGGSQGDSEAAQAAGAPTMATVTADGQKDGPQQEQKGALAKEDEAQEKGSDAKAALSEARAVRQKSGCAAAVKAYDEVGARFPATVSAGEAMWEAADCYKSMGDEKRAREMYEALRSYASYRDRAEAELAQADANAMNQQQSKMAVNAPPTAAPPAAAPPPAAVAAAPKMAAKAKANVEAPQAGGKPGGGNPPTKPAAPAPVRSQAADSAYGF